MGRFVELCFDHTFEIMMLVGVILFFATIIILGINTNIHTDQFKAIYVENCMARFELTEKDCWYLYKSATGEE